MINLIKIGRYCLVGTKDKKRMLSLDDDDYLWAYAKGIGEILTLAKQPHKTEYILARGDYRIYDVKDEPKYVDLRHLELSVGPNEWQGYLLLTGLPRLGKIRSRMVPTDEVVSLGNHTSVGPSDLNTEPSE